VKNSSARELAFNLRYQEGTDSDIACEFIEGVLEFLEVELNVFTDTEFAIPEELGIDEALLNSCEGGS
jgi:hypothetical protein